MCTHTHTHKIKKKKKVIIQLVFPLGEKNNSQITSLFTIEFYLHSPVGFFLLLLFFGCVGSSLLHVGFLQLQRAGATLHCSLQASHCSGFSCCGGGALGMWASVVAARRLSSCGSWALERRLSSCGAQAQLLRGMWDLPGPGIEPVSPALASGFLTTCYPGSPSLFKIIIIIIIFNFWVYLFIYLWLCWVFVSV